MKYPLLLLSRSSHNALSNKELRMEKPSRRGRKKEFDVAGWVYLPIRIPEEIWKALRIDCFRREKKHAELVRDLLEQHLERSGILQVRVERGERGREIKSYRVLEK
jgi:hypothetical protein